MEDVAGIAFLLVQKLGTDTPELQGGSLFGFCVLLIGLSTGIMQTLFIHAGDEHDLANPILLQKTDQ